MNKNTLILYGVRNNRDNNLLVLLATQASGAVGEGNVELGSALHDGLPLQGGDVVGDLAAEGAVVHHQHVEVGNVVH